MANRISKNLNLVIPVTRTDGAEIFVHSTPISADVFDTYFLPISKTFAAIYGQGLGMLAGPRVADKLLKKVSKELGEWEGPGGVEQGLMAEIRRSTTVMAPGKGGWEMLTFDDAVKMQQIDKDDAAEIEGALVFFMVSSAMHRKQDLPQILGGAMKLWGARTDVSNSTDYLNSLRTLTVVGSSGGTAAA